MARHAAGLRGSSVVQSGSLCAAAEVAYFMVTEIGSILASLYPGELPPAEMTID